MSNYHLLERLLPYLERYESEHPTEPDKDPALFAQWLLQQPTAAAPETSPLPPQPRTYGDTPAQIAQLLGLMYKYLRFYLRKSFDGTAISTPDDFGFLATLMMHGALQKNELIRYNTLDFSAGVEVIKRLEAANLVRTEPDPSDKRARLVALTEAGRGLLIGLLPQMQQIGRLAMGDLNPEEQGFLRGLLERLHHFHQPIFQQHKTDPMGAIFEKYVGG